MQEPSVNLASRAADRLRGLADRVTRRRPTAGHSLTFDLPWLADPAVLREIDADLKLTVTREHPAIYLFKATDHSAYKLLKPAFERVHAKSSEDLNFCRLMSPSRPDALYVGSGRDLRSRIGQHLGRIGGPGTYCMRLNLWATDVDASMELHYWMYEADIDAIELEALEQELWDEVTPLLGKRSGK